MNGRHIALVLVVTLVLAALWRWTALTDPVEPSAIELETTSNKAAAAPTGVPEQDREELVPAAEPANGGDAPEAPAEPASNEGPSVPTEPGVLEVEVWLGDERLPGALVFAAPTDRVDLFGEDAEEGHPDVMRGVTDANGLARLPPLPSDGAYCIRVRHGRIAAHKFTDTIDRDQPDWRYVFRLGAGGVEGRVFDEDGSPWVARLVQLNALNCEGCGYSFRTRTDQGGAYQIGGLPECFALVVLPDTNEDATSIGTYRAARVKLGEGEWRRVDFGSDQPKSRWTGRLRSTSGAALEVEMPIELEDVARGNVEIMETGSDGTFSIDLVPGRYRAEGFVFQGDRVLGEFEIQGVTLESDIVIAGALVTGRVVYVGSWPDKLLPARTVLVLIRDRTDEYVRGHASRAGDRYWFLGIEPGEYWVTTHPQSIVGADAEGRIPLVVPVDRSPVELDLSIQDP